MAMPVTLRRLTLDELDALPADGNRYELLDGVLLVTPGPGVPHQTVATAIAAELYACLGGQGEVRVWAPGVVRLPPSTELQPDVLVGRQPADSIRWEDTDRWLAVEISGRSSRVYDRDYKRDAYLELGVLEVWLVDLAARHVLVSRQGGPRDVPHDRDVVWRSPAGHVLQLDIGRLFAGLPAGE
jgi:Uma2 family endonuclease